MFNFGISIEQKTAGTRAKYFWNFFLQRAASGTSFDVCWSLVAHAIENELAASFKNVNLTESLTIV